MSIAGSFHPAREAPADAERLLRAIAVSAPRAWKRWRGDGAAMAGADGGAVATAPGGRVAMLDGRIHNRAELIRYAGCDADLDDVRLLLAVHARAGDDTPDRVIGDYAFAVWDGERRRLLAAVDPGGYRPLVLAEVDGGLAVASEARAILAGGGIARAIDEMRVAEWLAISAPGDPTRTMFAGIARVPPGSRAIWSPTGLAIDRWWRPEAIPTLRLGRHADYVAAVRDALDTAVADRIDRDAGIGSHLSGGLDSGIVTALAARRLADAGRRLAAFTAAPANSYRDAAGRFGDEWPHAAAVAARYPAIDHFRIANDAAPVLEMADAREGAQDVPLFNLQNSVWATAIERAAAARGISVLLTGEAGNMSFSYDGATLVPGLLRDRHWLAAGRALLAGHRAGGLTWRQAAVGLADGVLPPHWMRRLRALAGRRVIAPAVYSLIDPAFAARTGIVDRWAAASGGDLRAAHPGDGRALRLAVLGLNTVQGEFAAAARRLHGVDTRDPTRDRRLVELCLSIPDDQFLHHGVPRAIARGIGRDLLPAAVADERRRGRQAADWAHGIDRALPAIAADVARLRAGRSVPGWVDLDRMDRAVARWPGPDAATDDDHIEWVAVTRALAASRFVRRIEGDNA